MGMFVVAPASSFHHHHHHLQQQHHHHQHVHDNNNNNNIISDPHSLNPATALGVGVIPLLTAIDNDNNTTANMLTMNSNRRNQGIQFWQEQQTHHHHHHQGNYLKNKHVNLLEHNASSGNLVHLGGGCSGGDGDGGGATTSGGTMTCQDCGNQAKKDCANRRCRTCCKSRGFECPTHVKSTWVPASRRRERQLMTAPGAVTVAVAGSSGSTSGTKKPRLVGSQTNTTASHTSTSNTTPPRSFETSSSHQDASFKETMPGQVRAPAVFKCVRVTAVEDGKDEYAYQAVVKIGGHVFKGFLYDQGVENRDVYPNFSELHLGGGSGSGGGGGGGGGGRHGVSSSSPMIDPSDVYAASGGGLLGGSSYGNPIN